MQRSLHTDNQTTEELKKELTAIRNQDILKKDPEDFIFEQNIYSNKDNNSTTPNLASNSQLNKSVTQKTFIERHQFINQDAEYDWMANRVHQLIQAGTDPSDIGILFPKHKYVTALIPYLRKYPEINIEITKPNIRNGLIRAIFSQVALPILPTCQNLKASITLLLGSIIVLTKEPSTILTAEPESANLRGVAPSFPILATLYTNTAVSPAPIIASHMYW